MAEILLFARIDILDPVSARRHDTPRCVVIRTTSELQADVLQGKLVAAVQAEHRRWLRAHLVTGRPCWWRRQLATWRGLFRSRAQASKRPPAGAAGGTLPRRRAF